MKQQTNNIDVYFKTGVENFSFGFNKEKAWERLNKKRDRKNKIKYATLLTIVVIAGLLFTFNLRQKEEEYITNEFQKRQKLEEYERKLAGKYEEVKICYDCYGFTMKSEVKQAPEYQYKFMIY
jgi:hypothetical protein